MLSTEGATVAKSFARLVSNSDGLIPIYIQGLLKSLNPRLGYYHPPLEHLSVHKKLEQAMCNSPP